MSVQSVSSTDPTASAAQTSSSTSQSNQTGSTDALANEQTFLQLLVAQIKNQDPLQPADGTQFLSQLAQFSQLEQLIGIRQGVDALGTANASSSSTTDTTSTGTAQ